MKTLVIESRTAFNSDDDTGINKAEMTDKSPLSPENQANVSEERPEVASSTRCPNDRYDKTPSLPRRHGFPITPQSSSDLSVPSSPSAGKLKTKKTTPTSKLESPSSISRKVTKKMASRQDHRRAFSSNLGSKSHHSGRRTLYSELTNDNMADLPVQRPFRRLSGNEKSSTVVSLLGDLAEVLDEEDEDDEEDYEC